MHAVPQDIQVWQISFLVICYLGYHCYPPPCPRVQGDKGTLQTRRGKNSVAHAGQKEQNHQESTQWW